ncbi:MAG: NAD-dependent epimerase/dehydratase family protein [Methanotrichaceae archaeon]|nr:NAD-dependent epimerase/dehydratase family protein [Methanotrichaceae archaeon]
MTVLVTGGAGFIGSHLAEELLLRGEEVVVLDNMHTGSMANLDGMDIRVIDASCLDLGGLDLSPHSIYHLGIPSSSPMYKANPYLVGDAINGAVAVFELAKRSHARVVYASTSSLYSGLAPPHREDMVPDVSDYYTEARLAIERLALLYNHLFQVGSVGLRFFSVYGPRERSKGRYANMVSQFIWEMMEGRAPLVYGDGSQSRDFIYVKDVVRGLMLAMESSYQGVLNLGTGTSHSFNQVVEMISSRLGSDLATSYVENPIANYVAHTQADTSRVEEALGFRAKCSLEEGVRELVDLYMGELEAEES